MKKIIGCILSLLLVIGLAGCANRDEPVEPKEESTMTQTAVDLGINAENYPKIDGSTSTLVIRQAIFDAMVKQGTEYYTANYPAKASKTVPSYHLLIDGDVDMIIVPYASEDVLKAAKEKNVELEFHRIAAEALIFITPKENPAENITEEQVRSIYRDYAIKNWKELGGPDKELVPVCRNADSGSQSQLDNMILKGEEMHPDIKDNYIEMTMEGMLEQTAYFHNGNETVPARDCYALGYTLFTYLQKMKPLSQAANDLKILNYEGVAPSVESIADGTYPLSDGYYVVVRKGTPESSPVYRIIDWLCGEEGQKVIQDLDLIPCGK